MAECENQVLLVLDSSTNCSSVRFSTRPISMPSPMTGVLALSVLRLGTFPTLFLYGTVIQSIDTTHRQRLHRVLSHSSFSA